MRFQARRLLVLILVAAWVTLLVRAQRSDSREWLTWGGNPERSGWNRGETALSKSTVRNLELKWKTQIDKSVPIAIESGAAMLTSPLVVEGIRTAAGLKTLVLTVAASNTVAALDAATGKIIWQRKLENAVAPAKPANWLCTNTSTATPVIDKSHGLVYLIAADGRLHALTLTAGEDEMAPVEFVPPYSRNWSLNLVDGVLYTTVGRGCGNAAPQSAAAESSRVAGGAGGQGTDGQDDSGGRRAGRGGFAAAVASHMIAIDLNDPKRPISRFATSTGRPAGAWSRAGVAWAGNSILVQTADGAFDPATNKWGETLLRLAPRTLQLMDYFSPPNADDLNSKDLDYGSGGVVAFSDRNRQFVVSGGKDGTIYLLDGASLGGPDHRTPFFSLKLGNDAMLYASNGIWGAPAITVDSRSQRWIYVPMWGPPARGVTFRRTNGQAPDGSIMALRVATTAGERDVSRAAGADTNPTLDPIWISRNLSVPEPPVVANDVVFAISTGENTIQRHTDPRYLELYRRPNEPPPVTLGLTGQERGQHVRHAILYALDRETGQELYSSNDLIDDWTHFCSVTVAGGKVFVTTRQSYVYAFGLQNNATN